MLSRKASAFMVDNLLGLNDNRVKNEETIRNTIKNDKKICSPIHNEKCIHASTKTVTGSQQMDTLSIELCQNDLWQSFHQLGTEMIITKSGRRMFPAIRVKLHGLKSGAKYRVCVEFKHLDHHKYRYVYHSSKWMIAGTGDSLTSNQIYQHPDSPIDGALVQSQLVSFERIKLTNNEKSRSGQVSLISMQRFIPQITVYKIHSSSQEVIDNYKATFPQTSFIAVTAYQNQEITRLKIARNPFAKGFREAGKNRSSFEAMIESYGYPMNTLPFTSNTTNVNLNHRHPKIYSDDIHRNSTNQYVSDDRTEFFSKGVKYLAHNERHVKRLGDNVRCHSVQFPFSVFESLMHHTVLPPSAHHGTVHVPVICGNKHQTYPMV